MPNDAMRRARRRSSFALLDVIRGLAAQAQGVRSYASTTRVNDESVTAT